MKASIEPFDETIISENLYGIISMRRRLRRSNDNLTIKIEEKQSFLWMLLIPFNFEECHYQLLLSYARNKMHFIFIECDSNRDVSIQQNR